MTTQPADPSASFGASGPPVPGPAPAAPGPAPGTVPALGTVPAAGAAGKEPGQFTKPLRELVAYVLLGANALFMFLGLLDLLFGSGRFGDKANVQFGAFVGLTSIGLPLLAFLLATHVQPPLRRAKLITLATLIGYGVSALFGLVCLLAGFVIRVSTDSSFGGGAWQAIEDLLTRLGWFALLGAAAFVVVRVLQGVYVVPRPKRAPTPPGVYGQPTGYPPGYGQNYPQGYAQPGYPPGYGQQQAPAGYAQPAPTGYVQQPPYPQPVPGYPQPTPGYPAAQPPPGYPQAQPAAYPPPAQQSVPEVSSPFASYTAPASAPPVVSSPPVVSAPPVASTPPAPYAAAQPPSGYPAATPPEAPVTPATPPASALLGSPTGAGWPGGTYAIDPGNATGAANADEPTAQWAAGAAPAPEAARPEPALSDRPAPEDAAPDRAAAEALTASWQPVEPTATRATPAAPPAPSAAAPAAPAAQPPAAPAQPPAAPAAQPPAAPAAQPGVAPAPPTAEPAAPAAEPAPEPPTEPTIEPPTEPQAHQPSTVDSRADADATQKINPADGEAPTQRWS